MFLNYKMGRKVMVNNPVCYCRIAQVDIGQQNYSLYMVFVILQIVYFGIPSQCWFSQASKFQKYLQSSCTFHVNSITLKLVWFLSFTYQNLGVYVIAGITVSGMFMSVKEILEAATVFICKQPICGLNQIFFYRNEFELPEEKRRGKFVQNKDGCVLYILKDEEIDSFKDCDDETIK